MQPLCGQCGWDTLTLWCLSYFSIFLCSWQIWIWPPHVLGSAAEGSLSWAGTWSVAWSFASFAESKSSLKWYRTEEKVLYELAVLDFSTTEMWLLFLIVHCCSFNKILEFKSMCPLFCAALHAWDELPINLYMTSSLLSSRFPIWLLSFFLGGFVWFILAGVMTLKAVDVSFFCKANQCVWLFIPSSRHHFIFGL